MDLYFKISIMPKTLLTLLVFLSTLCLEAQNYRLSADISIKDINGRDMPAAWIGGLNNPHLHNMDLNGDGRQDLVIAEHSGQLKNISFIPLVHVQGSDFRYAPEYSRFFDNCECYEWAILKDFNYDSIPDVFCGRNPGQNFKVYKAVEHCRDSFSYVLQNDPLNFARFSETDTTAVTMSRGDMPAIADVDFDGDIDILTSNTANSRIHWYRNLAVEEGLNPGVLKYDRDTECWGHFGENDANDQLKLADTTAFGCEIVKKRLAGPRHSGSTFLVFDSNGDSLVEVLIGDVDTYRMHMALNAGKRDDALMTKAIYNYPNTDSSIYMSQFLRASYVDLNGDGLRDLSVNPHDPSPLVIENKTPILWYENTGASFLPNFRFRGRTLVVNDMVDAGFEAMPEFVDLDGDGLMDLLVGSTAASSLDGGSLRTRTEFHLYKNTGTVTAPEFRFETDLYLDFNVGPPFINKPDPAAGDLDNDGDPDLLIGAGDGRIYYYVNQAAAGRTASFQLSSDVLLRSSNGAPIIVFNDASPDLFDYDSDGDLDLFIGNGLGRIYYYENVGTATNFSFELRSERFGDIKISSNIGPTDTLVNVYPTMADYNRDGFADLIVGGPSGYVEIFTDAFQGLQKPLSRPDTLLEMSFRAQAAPAAVDLFDNGRISFVIGTEEGGLMLATSDTFAFDYCALVDTAQDTTNTDSTTNSLDPLGLTKVQIYPNPAKNRISIVFGENFPAGEIKKAAIYNQLGQMMGQREILGQKYDWNIQEIPEGLYFVRVEALGKSFVQKIIIRR